MSRQQACHGCERSELLDGETWTHLHGRRWHPDCLRRDQAAARAEREPARLQPGRPAGYSAAWLGTLDPEVAKLARSQHWDDVRPRDGFSRTIGAEQRPQKFGGSYTISLDAELDRTFDSDGQRDDDAPRTWLEAHENRAARRDAWAGAGDRLTPWQEALYPAALEVETKLRGMLSPDEWRVFEVVCLDGVHTGRPAVLILGTRRSTFRQRKAYVLEQLETAKRELADVIAEAEANAADLRKRGGTHHRASSMKAKEVRQSW